jgi:hypothetical protein
VAAGGRCPDLIAHRAVDHRLPRPERHDEVRPPRISMHPLPGHRHDDRVSTPRAPGLRATRRAARPVVPDASAKAANARLTTPTGTARAVPTHLTNPRNICIPHSSPRSVRTVTPAPRHRQPKTGQVDKKLPQDRTDRRDVAGNGASRQARQSPDRGSAWALMRGHSWRWFRRRACRSVRSSAGTCRSVRTCRTDPSDGLSFPAPGGAGQRVTTELDTGGL